MRKQAQAKTKKRQEMPVSSDQKETRGKKRRTKWMIFGAASLSLVFLLFLTVWVMGVSAWKQFDISLIREASQTLYLYDKDGEVVAGVFGSENRTFVPLSEIPQYVQNAFIAVEDVRFYQHDGIDLRRILGAVIADLRSGSLDQGASTITQQLIKLSHLSSEKTFTRKIQEILLAVQMERQYEKDEILEMYLNYVYFGAGAYGIEAAAERYFDKSVSELTLAEGALLAGIIKAPSRYAPHLNLKNSIERRDLILGLMKDYELISQEEYDKAVRAPVKIADEKSGRYPHGYYVELAMDEAREILGVSQEELLSGGYRIYTALDADLQQYCEELFSEDALFPSPAEDGEQVESAMVILDVQTGGIRALLGGREHTVLRGLNRATQIQRQPGSVIKPILVYAPALDRYGYTTASLFLDEPTDFNGYSPKNFGDSYHGWVTMREAISRSLNVPAVKLLNDIGVFSGKNFAQSVGISFDEKDISLSLALGGFTHGVSPLELCGAYAAFARGGTYRSSACVERITDSTGTVLYERADDSTRVMSEQSAFLLTSMLTSCITEGTGRRLNTGIPLAGKTGTTGLSETGGNKDAWMAAYNPEYAAAVWMGYDNSTSAHSLPSDATGGTYPAALLSRVFSHLYPDAEAAPEFSQPDGIKAVRLDASSPKRENQVRLANPLTPQKQTYTEYFIEGTEPDAQSDYWSIPLPPGQMQVLSAADGLPVISFSPRQHFVLYQLYRREEGGAEALLLGEYPGDTGKISHKDETAQFGKTYEYYVVPVHPELTLAGEHLTGPETVHCRYSLSFPSPQGESQAVDNPLSERLDDLLSTPAPTVSEKPEETEKANPLPSPTATVFPSGEEGETTSSKEQIRWFY